MIARLALTSTFLFSLVIAHAAEVQTLEKDLSYIRISDLIKDATVLESALAKTDLVLDLRGASGSGASAQSLASRLAQAPATANAHRLILLNPGTSPAIVEAASHVVPRQLTLGPRTTAIKTDIAVPTSVEDDLRAYAAWGKGSPLDKLIHSNPEKKRYDESALAKSHNTNAADASGDPSNDDVEVPATEAEAAPKKPLPPEIHDLVLERAVQIHDALQAQQVHAGEK